MTQARNTGFLQVTCVFGGGGQTLVDGYTYGLVANGGGSSLQKQTVYGEMPIHVPGLRTRSVET
jgi:hypothetical protein